MNSSDWWAEKLGTTPTPNVGRPDPTPPMPQSHLPMTQMPVFQPQTQAPSKAESARQTAFCPDCGSSNYFSATPQTQLRCYDCGYPVQQSGSHYGALSLANVDGTVKAANGNSGTSGFSAIPAGYGPNGQKLG
jgi:ribosomal protein S27E